MDTIQLLVISDNTTDIDHIKKLLTQQPLNDVMYEVDVIPHFQNALRSLVTNTHDVFLVDYYVPGTNVSGIDLIQRAYAGGCVSPIILLTNTTDEMLQWAAIAAGASDVLHKTLDLYPHPDCPLQRQLESPRRILMRAVRYAVQQHQQLQQIQKQLEKVQRQLAGVNRKLNRS